MQGIRTVSLLFLQLSCKTITTGTRDVSGRSLDVRSQKGQRVDFTAPEIQH